MDRYFEIKERLQKLAESDDNIRAAVLIGSSVRDHSKADEYSDIDVIVATEDTEEWLYGDYPEKLSELKISFVEPTLGGGMERRVLYDGSLDVDMIVFTPEQFENAIISGAANEVMNRGYAVMYDSMGVTELLKEHIKSGAVYQIMSENEFVNIVNDFFFHTVWASKKIMRGELWTAKMCIDAYLKNHLLKVMEACVFSTNNKDVWHCGRFLEKWAGDEVLDKLKSCFARYDREDMISALINTAELFGELARKTAESCNYHYPEAADTYAEKLLKGYFESF